MTACGAAAVIGYRTARNHGCALSYAVAAAVLVQLCFGSFGADTRTDRPTLAPAINLFRIQRCRRTYAPLPNRSAPSLARWVLYWYGTGVRGGVPGRGESVKQFMNSTGPGQRREDAPNTAPAVSGQAVGLKWRPFPAFPTGREDRWLVSM